MRTGRETRGAIAIAVSRLVSSTTSATLPSHFGRSVPQELKGRWRSLPGRRRIIEASRWSLPYLALVQRWRRCAAYGNRATILPESVTLTPNDANRVALPTPQIVRLDPARRRVKNSYF